MTDTQVLGLSIMVGGLFYYAGWELRRRKEPLAKLISYSLEFFGVGGFAFAAGIIIFVAFFK